MSGFVAGSGTVTIANYEYGSQSLSVAAGTKVVWTNQDTTRHTATASSGRFDTGSTRITPELRR